VPLIAVDGFSREGPTPGQTITFVLARELTVRGQTLAQAGDVASGQVSQVSAPKAPGEPMSVALERATLHVGSVKSPCAAVKYGSRHSDAVQGVTRIR